MIAIETPSSLSGRVSFAETSGEDSIFGGRREDEVGSCSGFVCGRSFVEEEEEGREEEAEGKEEEEEEEVFS